MVQFNFNDVNTSQSGLANGTTVSGVPVLEFTIFDEALPSGEMRFVVTPASPIYAFSVSADGGFVQMTAPQGSSEVLATYTMTFTDGAGRNALSDISINFGDVGSSAFVLTQGGRSSPATFSVLGPFASAPIGPVTGIRFFVSNSFSLFALSGTPTCFAAGTHIATPNGLREVQSLSAGDVVLTHDGDVRTVMWLGRQSFDTRQGVPPHLRPVRVAAGALGNGLPRRDLVVTADHALFVDGVLINAGALVNHASITFEGPDALGADFSVYHIETDDHAIILAEGTPAETFVDARQRTQFDNYADYAATHDADRIIAPAPYPRISSARMVPDATRQRLGTAALCA